MRQKFNPKDWLPKNEGGEQQSSNNQPSNHSTILPSNIPDDIELVVSRIESAHIDITGHYYDWRNLGFALADELAESGRDFFHRISRFYPNYSHGDCDKQYDQCLKSQGHGITIKTLFHMAKMAGIEVHGAWGMEHGAKSVEQGVSSSRFQVPNSTPTGSEPHASGSEPPAPCPEPQAIELPTLPDSIFPTLPDFLQKVVARADTNEERDILLLGSIVTLSACLPKVFGLYDKEIVYANLFLFITSQASAGKGRLVNCKRLVNPIHWARRKESQTNKAQYDAEMREYNLLKGKDFNLEKPIKPPEKMLFIPANNSTSGVFQLLAGNDGCGLVFETEGDTLVHALKTEYGDYSDFLRKAYHHEAISSYRKTDQVYEEIESPRVSMVITGTPKQVAALIPSAENGLFSRYIFYHMNIKPVWKNVFPETKSDNLKAYFDNLGQEFYPLYLALKENTETEFCLTKEQKDQFHEFFTQMQDQYLMLQGMDYMGTIRRMGLIAFRIAMVFTTLRILETGEYSDKLVCSDVDFQAALSMARVLIRHSSYVFSQLPEEIKTTGKPNKKVQFLEKLPLKFTRVDYIKIAKSLSIGDRSADRYIAIFCEKKMLEKEQYGTYINLLLAEGKNEE